MDTRKKIRFFSIALFTAMLGTSTQAHSDIRVLTTASYKSIDIGSENATGYGLRLSAQYDFVEPIPGLSLYGAAGVGTDNLKAEFGPVEDMFRPFYAGIEGGINFGLLPLLNLQGFVGYDFGLGGELENRNPNRSPTRVKVDLNRFSSTQAGARILFTAAPFVSVGLETAWNSARYKEEGAATEVEGDGYSIGAVGAFRF